MIVQDVINHLEELAPLAYAEDFDNVGLLVGDKQSKLTGILVTLDTIEAIVDEAFENNCNLIVSFHPIIFKGLKKLTGKSYQTTDGMAASISTRIFSASLVFPVANSPMNTAAPREKGTDTNMARPVTEAVPTINPRAP